MNDNNLLAGKDDYILIVFTSGNKWSTLAPSPSGQVRGGYGSRRDGSEFYVHIDDAKRLPKLYTLKEAPKAKRSKRKTKKVTVADEPEIIT